MEQFFFEAVALSPSPHDCWQFFSPSCLFSLVLLLEEKINLWVHFLVRRQKKEVEKLQIKRLEWIMETHPTKETASSPLIAMNEDRDKSRTLTLLLLPLIIDSVWMYHVWDTGIMFFVVKTNSSNWSSFSSVEGEENMWQKRRREKKKKTYQNIISLDLYYSWLNIEGQSTFSIFFRKRLKGWKSRSVRHLLQQKQLMKK